MSNQLVKIGCVMRCRKVAESGRLPFVLGLMLFLGGCIDKIPFDTGPASSQLVIYGQFSAYEKDHEVTIRRTVDFGKNERPEEGALVRIVDSEGNSAQYMPSEPGTYVLPKTDPFKGISGETYHIEITLQNGKSYHSSPQNLPAAIPVNDVNFELYYRDEVSSANVVVSKPYLSILVDAPTVYPNGEGANMRWLVEEEYLFIDLICGPFDPAAACHFRLPVDNTNFKLLETISSQQEELKGLTVFERDLTPQYQFNFKHVFNVHQYTMSNETYDYWERVKVVSNQTGSIFDQQPAGVLGNIVSESDPEAIVLGYFEVVGESVDRVSVVPDQLKPLQIVPACIDFIPYYRNRDNFCCFCVLIGDEIIPPPDYFLDE